MRTSIIAAVLAVLVVAHSAAAFQFVREQVDFSTWKAETMSGSQAAGNWAVSSSDPTLVTQTVNSEPGVFFSTIGDGQGFSIRGETRVATDDDNDFWGFVVGFDEGEFSNSNGDYLLVNWKQEDQDAGSTYGVGLAGLAVSRVDGPVTEKSVWSLCGPNRFTGSCNGVTELQRGSSLGRTGWADNRLYKWRFAYSRTRLQVTIEDTVTNTVYENDIDVTTTTSNPFPRGLLGLYTHSQAAVQFRVSQADPTFNGIQNTPLPFELDYTGSCSNAQVSVDFGDSNTGSATLNGGKLSGSHTFSSVGNFNGKVTVSCDNNSGDEIDVLFTVIAEVIDPVEDNQCEVVRRSFEDGVNANTTPVEAETDTKCICLEFSDQ